MQFSLDARIAAGVIRPEDHILTSARHEGTRVPSESGFLRYAPRFGGSESVKILAGGATAHAGVFRNLNVFACAAIVLEHMQPTRSRASRVGNTHVRTRDAPETCVQHGHRQLRIAAVVTISVATHRASEWSAIGRTVAKCAKSSSVVKIEKLFRTATAQIKKSVLEP